MIKGVSVFTRKSDEVHGQMKAVQNQLAYVIKRVNLIEAAMNTKENGSQQSDPEELRRLRAVVSRIDSLLKSTMKSTIELLDAFKDAQFRNEGELRSFAQRLAKLEGSPAIKA